jgi:hypothetical protein
MLSLKGTVAGRFLWQLGTPFVEKHGLASLQNCAFTTVNTPRAFTWAFDMLMLGSGVGYNVQREYVYKLPIVQESFRAPVRLDTASADFIIPDTREGWVSLLERTLESAFKESKAFTYTSQLIRGKGTPIKGFGGVASGPEDLCNGIAEISQILERRRGKQLNPIDCLDIMNIIGSIVVSGNVRRSAQIAIGDYDDTAFLRAKRWDLGNIPSWRAMYDFCPKSSGMVIEAMENRTVSLTLSSQGRVEELATLNIPTSLSPGLIPVPSSLSLPLRLVAYPKSISRILEVEKNWWMLADFYTESASTPWLSHAIMLKQNRSSTSTCEWVLESRDTYRRRKSNVAG